MNNRLTLHMRLTNNCNADCSYCSSYTKNPNRMSLSEVMQSMSFIKKTIIKYGLGGLRDYCSVNYIGGEVGIVPMEELKDIVLGVRRSLNPMFKVFEDGCQTNLVLSEKKIDNLVHLFSNRIGTSADHFTKQRTVKGSSDNYNFLLNHNRYYLLNKYQIAPSTIVVVNQKTKNFLSQEINIAIQEKHHITLRPVFEGGLKISDALHVHEIIALYGELFERWFLKQPIMVEPFYQLTVQNWIDYQQKQGILLHQKTTTSQGNFIAPSMLNNNGCPFQSNCARTSLSLEPNGDLYVCMDMADSKQMCIGNALRGEWDELLWNKLEQRSKHLDETCKKCEWKNSCQGGCMKEALDHTGDIFGKTELCEVWKMLFRKMEQRFKESTREEINAWLEKIKL